MSRTFYPEIRYETNGTLVDGVAVERLNRARRSQLEALVPAIIGLTRRAYSRQLEEPLGPLPSGTIAEHYTVEQRKESTLRRIDRVLAEWGAYFIVRSPDNPDRLDALASIVGTATLNPETGKEREWTYIFDVLADPPGQGLGSAVLHAAVKGFGGSLSSEGHLHAYHDSDVNEWYRHLGFECRREAVEAVEFGGTSIQTDHYGVDQMETVLASLEARYPALRNVRAID